MATIKTQDGKVILKDGKVSCSCCGGCCMYPAQALIDELYTTDDLPDEVLYNDGSRPPTILQKILDEDYPGGVVYVWPEDGSDNAGLIFIRINADVEIAIWAFGDDAGEGASLCLIQGDGNLNPGDDIVEDQFADTYTVSNDTISVTVTRIDVCNWIGTDSCGNDASLRYTNEIIGGEPYKWLASAYYYNTSCDPDAAPLSGYKEGNQNTPIGTYQNGVTVS